MAVGAFLRRMNTSGSTKAAQAIPPSAIARCQFDKPTRPVLGASLVVRAAYVMVALLMAYSAPAAAHETDQYTLPVGRDFADLGPHFSRIVYDAIVGAVDETNAEITKVVENGEPRFKLDVLQSPDYIAGKVQLHLFIAMPTNELLDMQLASDAVVSQFPGLVTVYQSQRSIYNDPLFLIDLTKIVRTFLRAGSVSVGGTVFGTDKFIHFINLGRINHAKYETLRQRGLSVSDATRSAVKSTSRNWLTSEDGLLGMWTTGIRSNGDLAANYAGLRFYRNLTEEVSIGRRTKPPMLVREGELWRVRIEPDSDFFTAFITPHWNETLNPNRYVGYTRGRIRSLVRERCADTLEWYPDERRQRMGKAQFEAIEEELATYFGEDYDHRSGKEFGLANVCFATSSASTSAPLSVTEQAATATGPSPDALGRTVLWWAARSGDVERLREAAPQRAELDAADHDGETSLHAAIRAGSAEAVGELLSLGADPNRAAAYGVTPLMLASAGGNTVLAGMLLGAGAEPNQRDLFGSTALFNASLRGNTALTELLLDMGADPRLEDDAGNTALRLATQGGKQAVVAALLARGADSGTRSAAGPSPEAQARQRGHVTPAHSSQPNEVGASAAATAAMPPERSIVNGANPKTEP